MLILGLNKTTLLDYPEHVAATIFTGGCNFRCPFCHNKDLVFVNEGLHTQFVTHISETEILSFLKKRKGILTGVCITGGEPTLQTDLTEFIQQIKELGYLVKLDTNGYQPHILHSLIEQHLIDYVAMDIKNSPEKYALTTGISSIDISKIKESVSLLRAQTAISYEFRTTIVRELHDKNDIYVIADWLSNAPAYYLQSFIDSGRVIADGYHPHTAETLQDFAHICRTKIPNTQLRGE